MNIRGSITRAVQLTVTLAISAALCLTFVTASPAQTRTTERTLFTILTGAQEVPPSSGDPNGIGAAALNVSATGRVDYALAVAHLAGDITSVHIHNAPRGQRGEDVFDLENPVNGFISGTVQIDPTDATAIIASPENYYIEIHTTAFPTGAIRGQLTPAASPRQTEIRIASHSGSQYVELAAGLGRVEAVLDQPAGRYPASP